MKLPFLLGRLVYGGFFLYHGIHHFQQQQAMTRYTATKKVPLPRAAVVASGALLTLAGASILSGVKPKYGVLGIAAFLAGVSPVMHDFWSHPDPEQRMHEMVHFSKNIALLGAGLALLGVEQPWPLSLPVEDQPNMLERARRVADHALAA